MKSNQSILLTVLVATALAGCTTPFRVPSDIAHIILELFDSPVVRVEKIWLERKSGPLVVKGYVLKRLEATDTTHTHLDVTLYNAAGRVLRQSVEHFEPRRSPGAFVCRTMPLTAGA